MIKKILARQQVEPTPTKEVGDPLLQERFLKSFNKLKKAESFAKGIYQKDVYRTAADLMEKPGGFEWLLDRAHEFDDAGVFHGGPWESLKTLLPDLVGAGLKGEGQYPIIEALSELRLLSVFLGRSHVEDFNQEQAGNFLNKVLCLNLDLLYLEETEESRNRPDVYKRANRLMHLLAHHVPLEGLREEIIVEINEIVAQCPILNGHVKKLIHYAQKLPPSTLKPDTNNTLDRYFKAITEPSPLSQSLKNTIEYRAYLPNLTEDELNGELEAFRESLKFTGFGNPYHAILIRFLARQKPERVHEALNLDVIGLAECDKYLSKVCTLIKTAVTPGIEDSIKGLSGLLNRGLLSRKDVSAGLLRLIEMDVSRESQKMLLRDENHNSGLTPNSILLSGLLRVLGHPLGVGQGPNTTCQSARAISLWAQHNPGFLLSMISTALRDDVVELDFEGEIIKSNELQTGITGLNFNPDKLDPVSRLLVPHLDKIYNHMMEKASFRGEDPHKWVNPAFYGQSIFKGFSSVFDSVTGAVSNYRGFLKHFFATHHPSYNGGYDMVYPNPVGLFVTDVNGNLLGLHAVSLHRIAHGPDNDLRAYFYNPNNESRQNWGAGVHTSVLGKGEKVGETSLPFSEFLSRLYAFHFNPYEEGDAYAVPESAIDEIERMAKESWGRAYTWLP